MENWILSLRSQNGTRCSKCDMWEQTIVIFIKSQLKQLNLSILFWLEGSKTSKTARFEEINTSAQTGVAGLSPQLGRGKEFLMLRCGNHTPSTVCDSVFAALYLQGQGFIVVSEGVLEHHSSQHVVWRGVIFHVALKLFLRLEAAHWNRNKKAMWKSSHVQLSLFPFVSPLSLDSQPFFADRQKIGQDVVGVLIPVSSSVRTMTQFSQKTQNLRCYIFLKRGTDRLWGWNNKSNTPRENKYGFNSAFIKPISFKGFSVGLFISPPSKREGFSVLTNTAVLTGSNLG